MEPLGLVDANVGVGGAAVVTLSVMSEDRRALPTTNHGLGNLPGGKIIPLPPRPPSTTPQVQLPKASGM